MFKTNRRTIFLYVPPRLIMFYKASKKQFYFHPLGLILDLGVTKYFDQARILVCRSLKKVERSSFCSSQKEANNYLWSRRIAEIWQSQFSS